MLAFLVIFIVVLAVLQKLDLLGSLTNILGEFINWLVYDAFRKKKEKKPTPPQASQTKPAPWTRKNNWPNQNKK